MGSHESGTYVHQADKKPLNHPVGWFPTRKITVSSLVSTSQTCLPIKMGLSENSESLHTTSFWGIKVRPKIISKGGFPHNSHVFPLVPMVFPWFSPNIYHFSAAGDARGKGDPSHRTGQGCVKGAVGESHERPLLRDSAVGIARFFWPHGDQHEKLEPQNMGKK